MVAILRGGCLWRSFRLKALEIRKHHLHYLRGITTFKRRAVLTSDEINLQLPALVDQVRGVQRKPLGEQFRLASAKPLIICLIHCLWSLVTIEFRCLSSVLAFASLRFFFAASMAKNAQLVRAEETCQCWMRLFIFVIGFLLIVPLLILTLFFDIPLSLFPELRQKHVSFQHCLHLGGCTCPAWHRCESVHFCLTLRIIIIVLCRHLSAEGTATALHEALMGA